MCCLLRWCTYSYFFHHLSPRLHFACWCAACSFGVRIATSIYHSSPLLHYACRCAACSFGVRIPTSIHPSSPRLHLACWCAACSVGERITTHPFFPPIVTALTICVQVCCLLQGGLLPPPQLLYLASCLQQSALPLLVSGIFESKSIRIL